MEKEIRAFWKTFPWIGVAIAVILAYLVIRTLRTGSIRFESTPFSEVRLIRWVDQPLDFVIVTSVLVVFLAGSIAYCVFRFQRRTRLLRMEKRRM